MPTPFEIINTEIEEVDCKYNELVALCENYYAQIFKRFDIVEIAFVEVLMPAISKFSFASTLPKQSDGTISVYKPMGAVRSLRFFEFERSGKKLQLFNSKLGIKPEFVHEYYTNLLPLFAYSVNAYLSLGIAPSEWAKGIDSHSLTESSIQEHIVIKPEVTLEDFQDLKRQKDAIYQKTIDWIKSLIQSTGYNKITIPEGKVMPAIADFKRRLYIIKVDQSSGKVECYYQPVKNCLPLRETITGKKCHLYPKVLKSVFEAIKYYREHPEEIPEMIFKLKSYWSWESI